MTLWSRLRSWLQATLGRSRMESEMDAELRFHMETYAADLVRSGVAPAEAMRRARIEFGGIDRAKEECREARGVHFLETLAQDVRYGLRTLRKSPGFTVVAVLTLSLGIGANTAIFSVVNGVLLKPLSYPHPDRLVAIAESSPPFDAGSISYPDFVDWTKMNHTFDALAAYRHGDFTLTGAGDAQHLKVTEVSASFFPLLGIRPVIGRDFAPDDDTVAAAPTLMLSEQLWRAKFGASPEIIGKSLNLDGRAYTVVGVVPGNFYFCCESMNFELGDAYTPIGNQNADWVTDRGTNPGIFAVGSLRANVTLSQARADMDAVSRNIPVVYPKWKNHSSRAVLFPLVERMAEGVKGTLLILLAAVGFVLLISCANVANLLLARATGRAREFAVRAALGATRRRVVRQLLTESLLLAFTGAILGIALARWGTQAGLKALPATLPRANDIGVDLRVLMFTLTVSILGGLFFGLAPALRSSRPNLHDTLKEGARGAGGARHRRMQAVFVITELALAVILVICAGLTLRSLTRVWIVDPGFDPRNILAFDLSLPPSVGKQSPQQVRAFLRRLPEEVAAIPGVQTVSLSDGAEPLGGDSEMSFWLEEQPKTKIHNPLTMSYLVSPDYLKVMKIPVIRGRFLSATDTEETHLVGVIDTVFAQTYFPNQDPIGHFVRLAYKDTPVEIVGVVAHVKQWGLDETGAEPIQVQLYTLAEQMPDPWMQWLATAATFNVRTESPNYPTADTIRSALAGVNSEQVAYNFESAEHVIAQSLAARRFTAILMGFFAAGALLLASIGIYGVMSYVVGQRTHEIGVRIALGASRADVLRIVLGDGATLAFAGVALGLCAAFPLTQLIASMLFGVRPHDPLTFVTVATLLTFSALAACYIPARRAMRVDPMVALRHE
jgi:predicted permease